MIGRYNRLSYTRGIIVNVADSSIVNLNNFKQEIQTPRKNGQEYCQKC